MTPFDQNEADGRTLRSTMRDLVAVSTLPAIWINLEPEAIAESLAAVLVDTLSLDAVLVELAPPPGRERISVLRGARTAAPLEPDQQAIARTALADSVRAASIATIPNPIGKGTVRVTATRFGVTEDHSMLIAASRRPDFPTEAERLLLGVAANQTAVALHRSRAESGLRQSEEELADFFETATIGMHWVGPDGRILRVNKAELDMLGYTRDEYIGRPIADFHADDEVICDILNRLKAGERLNQYPARLLAKDGSIRDVLIDSSVRWQDGQFVHTRCFTRDVTDLNRAEQRFRELADAMPHIVWTARPDGTIDYVNRRWTEFTQCGETVSAASLSRLVHPEDVAESRRLWSESLSTGAPFEMEMRLFDHQKNAYCWHLLRTVATRDPGGNTRRWFGTGTDIDEQKRAQQTSRYLAEASAALARVSDYENTLAKVATLAVPYFADWAALDVIENGKLRRLAVAHKQPDKIALAHELMRKYPDDVETGRGIAAVLRTGTPIFGADLSDEQLRLGAKDDEHFRLLRALGLTSYISVPLTASGAVFGALTFATAESGRHFRADDLAVAVDLAQRASVAVENTRLYEALRDGDRRKDEFLATLAHELRNPLAPIRNGLQILAMPHVGAEASERARTVMARQVDHMVRLVDDLLDVSRVMRGRIELRRESIELATIVARAVEIAQPIIDAQRHTLDIVIAAESFAVYADPVRLAQVVSNLLTNAAKYTPAGGRIRLSVEREKDHAVLRVQDNGVGIAPSMIGRVFDLFVQADQDGMRSQGGLGIGLTLVKNLIEMHGGTVSARSDGRGAGSEFILRVPIAAPADTELETAAPDTAAAPAPAPGSRVLIVDDNQDAGNSLATLLALQGHDVRVAFGGDAALTIARTFVPDVALVDLGMPGMDGFEFARRLHEQPHCDRVVLVALTGWGQQEDRRRTAAAGFEHHVVKPPDLKTLERLLGRT